MCRLRAGSAWVALAASVLSLAALAGCATTGANLLPSASAPEDPAPFGRVQITALSDSEAEAVVAQAIAEHEMRRP
jgi:hypothetical protein